MDVIAVIARGQMTIAAVKDGADGRGVASAKTQYAAASSQVSQSVIAALEAGTYEGVWTWQDTIAATSYSAAVPYLYTMTTLLDEDGGVVSRSITMSVWGKTGATGGKGADGKDGFSFSVDQSSLSFEMVTLEDKSGTSYYELQYNGKALSEDNCPAVHIYAYWGATSAKSITRASGSSMTKQHCSASASYGSYVTVKVTAVETRSVTYNGTTKQGVPYGSGYVSLSLTATSAAGDTETFDVTIPFTVSVAMSNVRQEIRSDSMTTTVSKLSSDVEANSGNIETLRSEQSEIRQTAESISLKVSSGTLDDARYNLLGGGMTHVAVSASTYTVGSVELEAGKTYTITAEAYSNSTGYYAGFWIYDSAWADTAIFAHTADGTISGSPTTSAAVRSMQFTPKKTAAYTIELACYQKGGGGTKPTSTSIYAVWDWLTVEEGSKSSGRYMLSADDYLVKPNLLKGTGTLTLGDSGTGYGQSAGLFLSSAAVKVDGRKLTARSMACPTAQTLMLYFEKAFDTAAGTTYTMSFYAKASSSGAKLDAYILGNGDAAFVSGTVGSDGSANCANPYGEVVFQLTTEWKKYWLTWVSPSAQSGCAAYLRMEASGYTYWLAGVKLREGGRADDWSDYGESAKDAAAQALLPTGVDVENGRITLTADNTTFRDNSGNVMGVFGDGGLKVAELHTISDDGSTVDIENGTVTATGSNGTRFVFGMDSSGNAVLNYYAADGTLKYSLGPGGLDAATQNDSAMTATTFYNVTSLSMPAAGGYATGTQLKTWFNNKYKGDSEKKFRYTAARQSGNVIADSKYTFNTSGGSLTQAQAAEHDGKWHSQTGSTYHLAGTTSAVAVTTESPTRYYVSKFGGTFDSANDRYRMTVYYFAKGVMTAYRTFYCTKQEWQDINGILSPVSGADQSVEMIS